MQFVRPRSHYEMKLGDVVTNLRASGFGVVTVEYKYLGFAVRVF